MVFDSDDEFKAYSKQAIPVNGGEFTGRDSNDLRDTHSQALNTLRQPNANEQQLQRQHQQEQDQQHQQQQQQPQQQHQQQPQQQQPQQQPQQQDGPILSSLLASDQFSSLSTASLYGTPIGNPIAVNDKLRVDDSHENYGRNYTTQEKLSQIGDPTNQQFRAFPFNDVYGVGKQQLNDEDKINSNSATTQLFSSSSQSYVDRPKDTSLVRPTKSLSPETLNRIQDEPGTSMMNSSTLNWTMQHDKSNTRMPSRMEHVYVPNFQMKGRISQTPQQGSREPVHFSAAQQPGYLPDGMPLEYTGPRNSAAHEASRYMRPGRERAHGPSNNYRVSRLHRHSSSFSHESERQMVKGHKTRSHRRKSSRTADSTGSGTLSMALVAPTLVPGLPLSGGSMGPQISEPPGGVYWALLSKFVDEGRTDPSDEYLQGCYEESVTVPIQMCQPPLSNIYPAYPHALEGDQAPRIRKQSKYTAEQDRQILELKNKGKAWAEIARLAKCHNQLAARNRYQVLIGQQGGGSFLWTTADCAALQAILDEGERAKWLFLASEMSKKLESTFTIDAVHYKICQLFASTPERFGVIRTRDPNRGGAPFKRKLLESSDKEPSIP